MEGPFTESRKITLNGNTPKSNGTGVFGVYNGKSENNETYEIKLKVLIENNPRNEDLTILLNRDGVELWKLKVAALPGNLESLHLSYSYNGTVYKANWTQEQSSENMQQFMLKLSNDHKFLEFVFNKLAQSGNFSLKSNFIAEIIEALFRD